MIGLIVSSFDLFPYEVEPLTHYLLQFEFGSVDIFRQREILGGHLIYAEFLHLVDIPGDDGFDQIFAEYVHRQHLVIFLRQDHRTPSAIETGIGRETGDCA